MLSKSLKKGRNCFRDGAVKENQRSLGDNIYARRNKLSNCVILIHILILIPIHILIHLLTLIHMRDTFIKK